MRQSCIVLVLVTMVALVAVVACFAADTPKPTAPAPKPLEVADRLQLREAQLNLAQAHITHLQTEAQVVEAEGRIGQLLQSLKKQYACPDCALNNDFTWTPAPTPSAAAAPSSATTPTPTKRGGTN